MKIAALFTFFRYMLENGLQDVDIYMRIHEF